MPPKRIRTDDDRVADRDRRAALRVQQQAAAASTDPAAAENAIAEFRASQIRDANRLSHVASRVQQQAAAAYTDPAAAENEIAEFRASQLRDANRLSQVASRVQQQAAAASTDPAAAENAIAEFRASQAQDRAIEAQAANRSSQSASRASVAAQRASQSAHAGAQLDALLYVDTFTPENIDLIEKNYERNVSAALCYFSANTAVAFGMRCDVNMDAQLYDTLGDPNDPSSAANGVSSDSKTACINAFMSKMDQRVLRACVTCGVCRALYLMQ